MNTFLLGLKFIFYWLNVDLDKISKIGIIIKRIWRQKDQFYKFKKITKYNVYFFS